MVASVVTHCHAEIKFIVCFRRLYAHLKYGRDQKKYGYNQSHTFCHGIESKFECCWVYALALVSLTFISVAYF